MNLNAVVFSVVSITSFFSMSWSCIGPKDDLSCGIRWNNGEVVNTESFYSLAGVEEGTNYLHEISEGDTTLVYRAQHYSDAMVRLKRNELVISVNKMEDKENLVPHEALRTELEWLRTKNIISMSNSESENIVSKIESANGFNAVYYTKENVAVRFTDVCRGKEGCINPPKSCGLDIENFILPTSAISQNTNALNLSIDTKKKLLSKTSVGYRSFVLEVIAPHQRRYSIKGEGND